MANENYRIVQYTQANAIIVDQIERINTYAVIPVDNKNCDYLDYLKWKALGNTAPIIPPAPIVPITSPDYQGQIESLTTTVQTGLAGKLDVSSGATAAQMKAGIATNSYASPAVIQKHPAACKAWVSFSANGVVEASYGVTSVVKNSAGLWTISFSTPFSSVSYLPIFTCELTLISLLSFGVKAGTKAVGNIQVTTSTLLGVLTDPAGKLYFAAYGDQ